MGRRFIFNGIVAICLTVLIVFAVEKGADMDDSCLIAFLMFCLMYERKKDE